MKTKRILLMIAVFLIMNCSLAYSHRVSLGVAGGLPLGDFGDGYDFGFGGSLRYELPIPERLGLTVTAGFLSFGAKDLPAGVDGSWNMMPFMAGLKYYSIGLQQGFYGTIAAGVTASAFRREQNDVTVSTNSTDFTLAPGIGYHFDYIDVGLNYTIIFTENESSSYLGLRIAYLFGHKESHH